MRRRSAILLCYCNGDGVAVDKAEAAKWFKRAAEAGNADAQSALSESCENGDGVDVDEAAAEVVRRVK